MMDLMKIFEHRGPVHPAVHPVKISVVNDEHQRECSKKIKPAMFMYVPVIKRKTGHGRKLHHENHDKSEDADGEYGITHLPQVITVPGKVQLDLLVSF